MENSSCKKSAGASGEGSAIGSRRIRGSREQQARVPARHVKGREKQPLVIVVGSGMSGLAAARALRNDSVEVIVLEARDRIGGRIHTDYSLGFPLDLGAAWLHGVSRKNPLAAIISRLQLPLYRTSGDDSILYDHDLESYALFDGQGSKIPQEAVVRVGDIFEDILEETRRLQSQRQEDCSMKQAMEEVQRQRPDLKLSATEAQVLQWYICRMEGWFAADLEQLSAKNWEEEEHVEGGHGLMVKGYWPVLSALSTGLDIRLNHRVVSISRTPTGVSLVTSNGATFNADAAVLTIPLGVLQTGSVKFSPQLPKWKQFAIDSIGVGNENKIVLLFDRVFWPNVEFIGLVAPTSLQCGYFLNLHKAIGQPVLVYMPSGSMANDLEKLTDEDAVSFTMEQVRQIWPGAPKPLNFKVTRWGSDPNSRGCYTFDKVGASANVCQQLRAPVGCLFFAGEATSRRYPGTVHGAYSTGLQAARECRQLLEQHGKVEFAQLEVAASVSAVNDGVIDSKFLPLRISRL